MKAALTVPGALEGLDPQPWLRLGAVGLWVLVVSLLALRDGIWPKPLAYVGIGSAIVYWLSVAGIVLRLASVIRIKAGASAFMLVPIWYIWLGLRLRKAT